MTVFEVDDASGAQRDPGVGREVDDCRSLGLS